MSSTKFIQYIHRPNKTELGMGNTHETYMLIGSTTDLSKVFPVGNEVLVEDSNSKKQYKLKSSSGNEFRVNQMGEIYRDYNIKPGDEIIITQITNELLTKTYFAVRNFNRVILDVGTKGVEVINIERLYPQHEDNKYTIITESGKLIIVFKESKKKRTDSPNETDYYNVELNEKPLSKGTYYVNINDKVTIESLDKSSFSEIELEDSLLNGQLRINRNNFHDIEETNTSYRKYITAIKTKPFLLLAGISGTGKSRIVRELARACWEEGTEEYKAHKPKNFEMVQIKPNWHDSSELIGYVSRVSGKPEFIAGDFLKFVAKAWENLDVPHFLCLDEMNLAPVEQYFAEYLSVVESRKCTEDGTIMTDSILKPEYKIDNDSGEKIYAEWYDNLVKDLLRDCSIEKLHALTTQFKEDGISIPQNLIVVGTVNMDETTFSFSRKVLDRAMTIEMNEVDLKGGLENRHEQIGKLSKAELIGMAVEGVDVYKSKEEVCDKVITYLQKINDKLEGTPFKVAYRTRNEFLLYVVNNLPYKQEGKSEDFVIQRALDEITSMKVLSRIEGDETKVSRTFLNSLEEVIRTALPEISVENSVSLKKLTEMKKRLESGYTSFWS